MDKNTIIIGYGEIGKALEKTLSSVYNVYVCDIGIVPTVKQVDVIHVCFPYSKGFVNAVNKYKKLYSPKYVIIHSTVPVGTAEKCNCYYSPVRGIHPHLEESLKVFVKYIAPKSRYLKLYFNRAGITTQEHESTKTLEAMKLYCTTIYGLNIIIEKEIWDYCKTHGLDYKTVYTDCNQTYNDGYKKLGFPHYTKYVLKHVDGKLGGHCVIPNCKLLGTDSAKFIKKQNRKYI